MPELPGMRHIQRTGDMMRIRKLTKAEHGVTRILWEEVFTEDEDAFLDYYYEVKATENTIYVIEDDAGDPLSMLQLNPYSVRFGKKDRTLHYIVAVATREKYRGRGYMRELLETSASEMYRDGEPFTFLMPAAEAIYYPHGFRFVYRQRQIDGKVKDGLVGEGTVRPATLSDCHALARFAEEVLSETEWVRAVRTEEYYRTLVKEQQSEGGRILVTECKGQIRGFVLYGYWEGKAELREPFVYQEKDWQSLAAFLEKEPVDRLHITGILPRLEPWIERSLAEPVKKDVPMIMARIVHLGQFLESFRAKADFTVKIQVEDERIPENTGCWEVYGENGAFLRAETQEETTSGDTDEKVTPGDLVTALFGYDDKKGRNKNEEKDTEKDGRSVGTNLRILADGVVAAPPVFLNEIV